MNQSSETLLDSRELFYVPANMTMPLFCGDERPSNEGTYIHVFGGAAANAAYNLRITKVIAGEPLLDTTFASETADTTVTLVAEGFQPGVHSAENEENGHAWDASADNDIDCGYLKKRQAISQLISDNAEAILNQAADQEPQLFADAANRAYGCQVVEAHRLMAGQDSYFTTGRDVGNAAIEKGAKTMNVRGPHKGVDGIRNKRSGTTIDSTKASEAGLYTYDHDVWAIQEIYVALRNRGQEIDETHIAIADLIDSLGTMMALGVTTVATRQPNN